MQYHISLTEHAINQFRKRFTDTLCKMPSEIATLFNILNSGELVRRDGRWVVLNGPFEGRLVRKEFGKYILTTVVRVHKEYEI